MLTFANESTAPDLDPGDQSFIDDPYPTFARLRRTSQLHLSTALGRDGEGLVVAVSHAACSELLRHRSMGRLWTDLTPAGAFEAFNLLHRNSLLECEGERHGSLRRLVSAAFARGHVKRLLPAVRDLAGELVDGLVAQIADGGSADLVAQVAEPLPVRVIGDLLGVPVGDQYLLIAWSNAIVKMYEPGLSAEQSAAAERAAREFVDYLTELAARRTARPTDDLISDLVAVRESGEGLSTDELVGTAVLLLMAGHEATVNVVANGTRALLANPDQWQRLLADRTLVSTAVDEMIRFDSPLQLFERTVLADTTLAGVTVQRGQTVAALLGAAARDPKVFTDPDRFDVGRQTNPHLGFGAGVHYCLGAPLARLEVGAVLDALLDRAPGLAPAGESVRRAEFVIRGLTTLPVTM